MSLEKSFERDISSIEISESRLYYDLGYNYVFEKEEEITIDQDFTIYLIGISLLLFFAAQIFQVLTLTLLIIFSVRHATINRMKDPQRDGYLLGGIMLAHVLDHFLAQVIVQPGSFITPQLNFTVWGLEIIWIILYGVEVLVIYQPRTSNLTYYKTVRPMTEITIEKYTSLKERLDGTEYQLDPPSTKIDLTLLRSRYIYLLQALVFTLVVIIFLDFVIWEIMAGISGGQTVRESYLVSGIALILLLVLLVFSPALFREKSSPEDNED